MRLGNLKKEHAALAGLATLAATLLSGCGMVGGLNTGNTGGTTTTLKSNGSVFGGQQPVSGALIQLYATGTTGTGSASTALISTPISSNAAGFFTITGTYTCPSATSQVYLTATGGNSGSGVNSAIGLAAALGSCGNLNANTFIQVNELTTISAAYALSPFEGSAYTSIGATGTAPTGLANAFNSASTLVSTANGVVATPATGITLPTTKINTFGDILAACVNTSSPSSSGCSTLLSGTGNATNTLDAAFYMAKNPGTASVIALYSLSNSTAPFQPTLTTAPKDFTLSVTYTGTELKGPAGIAIDASGNALIANSAGSTVVAAPPLSTAFATASSTGSGGLVGPRAIAVDTNGFVWVANTGAANVVKLSNAYTAANFATNAGTAIALSGSAADAPVAITTDRSGNAYTANPNSNKVYSISAASAVNSLTATTLAFPTSIAYSPNGNLQVGNAAGQICTTTTALGTPSCVQQANAQAIAGVAYVPGSTSSVGFATTLTGTALTGAYAPASGVGPFSGGGLTQPTAIAFGGSGKAFVANTNSISVFAAGSAGTALSPTAGYSTVTSASGIAVDPSGNVWVTSTGDNSLRVFIGLAAPTVTPIAANNP